VSPPPANPHVDSIAGRLAACFDALFLEHRRDGAPELLQRAV
jgi:hypothetical protein